MPVLLIAACVLWPHKPLGDIALPYGLQSYQQLTAELCERGIPTSCEPSIRHRFALIRIPPKPWGSLQPLLESALGVKFFGAQDGSLEIRKDPQEAAEAEVLMRRLARQYSQTIEDAVHGGWNYYEHMIADSSRFDGMDPVANCLDSIRSLPTGNPDRNVLSVSVSLKEEAGHRYVFADLWNGIDLTKLLRGMEPAVSTDEEVSAAIPPENPIGEILPSPIKSFGIRQPDGEATLAPIQVDRWRFDPKTFSLTKELVAVVNLAEPAFGKGSTEVVPETIGFESRWEDLYRGLAGQAAFRARQQATSYWLASKAADLPIAGVPSFTSEIFEKWSSGTQRPLIMEVLPYRDFISDLPFRPVARLKISDYLRGLSEEGISPGFLRTPWSIEDIDGVAVVRDELRFADHQLSPNPAAAIALRMTQSKSPEGLNSLDDFLFASGLLSAEEQLTTIDSGIYGASHDFPFAAAYLRLIRSDSTLLKEFKSLSLGEELRIPAARFPNDAKRKFERALRDLALRNPTLWSTAIWPEFDQVLATASILIQANQAEGRPHLRFQLVSPLVKSPKWGLCPADLGPVSLEASVSRSTRYR